MMWLQAIQVRVRAFAIWQKLGYLPWRKVKADVHKSGSFYKDAFNDIPFLNDDAKRTFVHLLLRPGYMIRDYIRGDHERYLAPLTALIIFYAFFSLIWAVLQPVQPAKEDPFSALDRGVQVESADTTSAEATRIFRNTLELVRAGYIYLHLDTHPEAVHTRRESALAAFENKLRGQGIPLFLRQFFLLWLAMGIALRRFRLGMSANAAASAYILCQFSFFMLFTVLLSLGESRSIGTLLMLALLTVDYRQLLGVPWKRSLGLGVKTGIWYGVLYVLALLLVSVLAVLVAWLKNS
ncbi:MAG TPA: hypothetical protein DCF48_01445 [Rikenellaceae bacterium]|nr:hypothetical protein [Rikenellaceae bacterium]